MPTQDLSYADCVVVGFDDSRFGLRALDAAAEAALFRQQRLVVLFLSSPSRLWNDELEDLYRDGSAEGAEAAMVSRHATDHLAHGYPSLSVRVVHARQTGDETVRMLGAAAQLLVLGQRGAGGQRCLSMGSTSEAIARAFSCPVLVVHDGYRCLPTNHVQGVPWGRVVAGVDGHGDTEAVLAAATHEAALRAQPLVAVHATHDSRCSDHATSTCLKARGTGHPRAAAEPSHTIMLSDEDPVSALVDHVSSLDLLVIGTRGAGRLAGLVQGSVSRAVLGTAPCDVLVVQARSDAAAAPARRTGLAASTAT